MKKKNKNASGRWMRGDASSRLVASSSLSLLSSFCAQKSSVLFVLCRKANEAFWSVSRSFGMEKKAEVLHSLSLSPLSETQRERERARANDRRLHTGDARNGREKEAPFSAFL